jgi:phage gp36-like protein
MFRRALLRHVLPAFLLLAGSLLARAAESPQYESRQSENEKEAVTQRQAALALLDEVMSGAKSLGLPQNRIAIEGEAFPIVWSQNQSQARALVQQMEGDFA